jgi:hypothetical protein
MQAKLTDKAITKLAQAQLTGVSVTLSEWALSSNLEDNESGEILYKSDVDNVIQDTTNQNTVKATCVLKSGQTINATIRKIFIYDSEGDLFAYAMINAFDYSQIGNIDAQFDVYFSVSKVSNVTLNTNDGAVITNDVFSVHNHDARYYLKSDTQTTEEIDKKDNDIKETLSEEIEKRSLKTHDHDDTYIKKTEQLVKCAKIAFRLNGHTNAGYFSAGAWRTYPLNILVYDDISGVSLTKNEVTLPSGTYYFKCRIHVFAVGTAVSRLRNITDNKPIAYSIPSDDTGGDMSNLCIIEDKFTINAESVFSVQIIGQLSGSYRLGRHTNYCLPNSGASYDEFGHIIFTKIG